MFHFLPAVSVKLCILSIYDIIYFFRLWAPTNKLKQSIQEGKFDLSPQYKDQIDSLKLIRDEPELESLLYKIRQKKELENETKEKPWYVKVFTSSPEL